MQVGADHRLAEHTCLNCGKVLDGAFAVGADAKPAPGDVSMCIVCGHLMAFADDMSFRELTAEEAHDIAGDPKIIAASRALASIKRKS